MAVEDSNALGARAATHVEEVYLKQGAGALSPFSEQLKDDPTKVELGFQNHYVTFSKYGRIEEAVDRSEPYYSVIVPVCSVDEKRGCTD